MIGFLEGSVAARGPDACLLDVGGVGYRVACPTTTLAALPRDGDRARLFTHLHVREDALALYGFATEAERAVFEALIAIAGVGPKVALAVCSAFGPDDLRNALAADDADALASVPGIGKKTAQRIVLDLREKLSVPAMTAVAGKNGDARDQARSALENLGYSPGEVRAALADVVAASDDDVEELVRSALRTLA